MKKLTDEEMKDMFMFIWAEMSKRPIDTLCRALHAYKNSGSQFKFRFQNNNISGVMIFSYSPGLLYIHEIWTSPSDKFALISFLKWATAQSNCVRGRVESGFKKYIGILKKIKNVKISSKNKNEIFFEYSKGGTKKWD